MLEFSLGTLVVLVLLACFRAPIFVWTAALGVMGATWAAVLGFSAATNSLLFAVFAGRPRPAYAVRGGFEVPPPMPPMPR